MFDLEDKKNLFEEVEYGCSEADSLDAKYEEVEPWQNYPFNLTSYNPLTEWGTHYARIFERDLFPRTSEFDILEMDENNIGSYLQYFDAG